MSGVSFLSSCSEEKHATEINLPDSALVGTNLPVIDGTLSEYYSVVPEAYVLNLQDSILTLKVKVRHDKKYVPEQLVSVAVGNPDSLASKFPYIVLVDSAGTQIENFRLDVDTLVIGQLDSLLTVEPGGEIELTFTAPNNFTVGQLDSLALVAKNFSVVANQLSKVDSAAIEKMLKSYKGAVSELNSFAAGFSGGAPMGMAAQMFMQILNREKAQARKVESVKQYMTPEQLAEYNKIRATRTKSSFAR